MTPPSRWISTALLLMAATLARAEAPPNILHIHADDLRADGTSALGNPQIHTPNLDALVARGRVFTRCYTMGSMIGAVCTPSRTMLLTGRSWQRIPSAPGARPGANDPATFLPRVLAAAGYQTWHCGKGGNAFTPGIQAFQTNIVDNGNGKPDDPAHDRAHSSQRLADRAIAFLEARAEAREARPFYMYLAPPVPHDPRAAEPRFHALYDPERITLSPAFLPLHPFDNGEMTVRDEALAPWPRAPEDTRRQLAEYYACITGLDHHVGRILDALAKHGLRERTVVVFTSDNGLSIGDHGLFGKQNLYEFGGMHVPCVIAGPGIAPGRSNALVYLMDLFPTFCELAGAKPPEGIDGRGLVPILQGRQERARDVLYTGYRDAQRSLRDDRWKLIRYPLVDRTQLFDLETDPHELANLADRPEHAARLERMLARLESEMRSFGDLFPLTVANPRPAEWTPPGEKAKRAARTRRGQ